MEGFDYTRVQYERCPVCGNDVASVPAEDLPPALADAARRWSELFDTVLDHPGGVADLTRRPDPGTWSAVEYGCHVRDVLSLFGRRVELMLLSDRPEFGWWDHEAAVDDDHYLAQDGRAVAADIEEGATHLALLFRRLTPAMRARSGTRLGRPFSAEGLVRFALHEMQHHLADARRSLSD